MMLSEHPGRIAKDALGKEHLFFSGTAYLGMSRHAQYLQFLQEGLAKYGSNYGSSRRSNVQLSVFGEAEDRLSTLLQQPAALTFSSGMLAGKLVLRYLDTAGYHCTAAPGLHPALYNDPKQFFQQQYAKWLQSLKTEDLKGKTAVLTNSIDPLHCEPYDLNALWETMRAASSESLLIIDDSHGIGVAGSRGEGLAAGLCHEFPDCKGRVIVTGSLGKALGLPGGFIAGDARHIHGIQQLPEYGGSSPMIPAYLYAFNQLIAQAIYAKQLALLRENIQYFKQKAGISEHFNFLSDYPVFNTLEHALSIYVMKHEMIISSFPYPKESSPQVTRIVLNALHTNTDIDQLHEAIKQYFKL